MHYLTALLVLACLMNSCRHGMTAEKFPPAQSPKGATVRVTTDQRQFTGELIEVRAAGLVVLTEQILRLLPYNAILSSRIEHANRRYGIKSRRAPEPEVRDRLRLLSRFPYGLTPELLDELLRAYGQTQLAGVNP